MSSRKHAFAALGLILFCVEANSAISLSACYASPVPPEWQQSVLALRWVAYSPTNAYPARGIQPTLQTVREDLLVLREARFTGLVTYSASGVLGREFVDLAQSLGFRGIIIGVWDPTNADERLAAISCSKSPVVVGFCVGNEGLGSRYQIPALKDAMQQIREATGKPVATTEEIDDYADEEVLGIGDWVFPNAHPYFHSAVAPDTAVRWTENAYEALAKRSNSFVFFKEVGLPTAGDDAHKLSQTAQSQYYLELANTSVRFVYFEAFDQRWKSHLPVEPHWGIFCSDRHPKLLACHLMGIEPTSTCPMQAATPIEGAFYVYLDAAFGQNHFSPTGYMGDCGDIHIDEAFEGSPHSGQTCIRVTYDAKGHGPNECSYTPPCRWAGVYWQHPQNNWGKDVSQQGRGLNLKGYTTLAFWARADRKCKMEFKMGGLDGPYGDTLNYPRSTIVPLDDSWREFRIDLSGGDLSHIIGGFCVVCKWETTPEGIVLYLDDIRYEK